jgi:outer membrane protein assembly factor BamB
MNKKLFCLVTSMLMFATTLSVAGAITTTNNKSYTNSISAGSDWWPMIGHDAANTRSSSSPAPAINQTFLVKQILTDIKYQSMFDVPGELFPIIDNGQLSFQILRDDNANGGEDLPDNIYSINPIAGTQIWKKTVTTGSSVTYSVAQDDDKLIVARMGEGLQCRNIKDGALLWVFPVQVYSPPVIENHNIYFLSYDKLHCINIGGVEVWNVSFDSENIFYNGANPAVSDGKVVTAVGLNSYQVLVSCFDATTGASIWTYTIENEIYTAAPTVVDGKVFVVACDQSMEQIFCLDASGNGDGTTDILWSIVVNPPYDGLAKPLAVSSGYVYGNAISMDGSFMIFCLDATTGAEMWEYPLWDEAITPSAPVVADGKVFFSGRNTVYCIDSLGNGDGTTDLVWSYTVQNTEPQREHFLAPIIGPGKVWVGYIYYIGFEDHPWPDPDYQVYGLSMYGFGSPNSPPAPPDSPFGPSEGIVGEKMTFTTKTTDPNNDNVYYQWQFGTNITDWLGPFSSGKPVSYNYTWTTPGSTQVKVRAKDDYSETPWSVLPVTIYQTTLAIGSITGGTSVSTEIQNTGTLTGSNILWTISVKGGLLGFIKTVKIDTISSITAGGSEPIKTGFILGLGPVTITVNASGDNIKGASKTANGFVFFFYIMVK